MGEAKRADLYNQYAYSMFKSLKLLDSKIGMTSRFSRAWFCKPKRENYLQTLIHQRVCYEYSIISSIMTIIYSKNFGCNIFEHLDSLDKEISYIRHQNNRETDYLMFYLMSGVARAYAFFVKGRKDLARESSLTCLKQIEHNLSHVVLFPIYFVKILSKLAKILTSYEMWCDAKIIISIMEKLPYLCYVSKKVDKWRNKFPYRRY